MAKALKLGTALAVCFTMFGCSPPSEKLQEQFHENDVFRCEEQASMVTGRNDPEWQRVYERCMQTGQL
jgi:hypothetical protein